MNNYIMIITNQNYDRVTFSLPKSVNTALGKLKIESNKSKSEIIKIAIECYLIQQEERKLKKAAQMMLSEYENNNELTALTDLDSEDFL